MYLWPSPNPLLKTIFGASPRYWIRWGREQGRDHYDFWIAQFTFSFDKQCSALLVYVNKDNNFPWAIIFLSPPSPVIAWILTPFINAGTPNTF